MKEVILKPGLKLIGAKTKLRPILYEHFYKNAHLYIEPFLGSGTVLVGKTSSPVEVVGDINPYVINFYRVLQDSPERFWEWLQQELGWFYLSKDPKSYFIRMRINVIKTDCEIERAALFYLITKHCMNGIWRLNKKGECNSSYCGTTKGRGIFTREWFNKVVERVKNVQFYNCRYEELLEPWVNYHDVFFFFDPPYSHCKTTYNGIRWENKDFELFSHWVSQIKGKWLITLNDNEFIRQLFKEYVMIGHEVNYSCSQTNQGRGLHKELIIKNY